MRSLLRLFRFLVRVQGVVVTGVDFDPLGDFVTIEVRRRRNAKPRCSVCKRVMGGRITRSPRQWRHLDLFQTRCYLVGELREGCCPVHGRRAERVPWAAPRANHTHAFDRRVAALAQVADKSATSRVFGIAWRTVGTIIQRVVERALPKDRLDGLTHIGVDENSYKRGHRYLTVVTCLRRGLVLWVSEGKSAETLSAFFRELGRERCKKLEVITMDMSGAYQKAVAKHAPQADIVFDRFHVVQLLLEAIDEVRREEVRKAPPESRRALKGTRYGLLANPSRYEDYGAHLARRIRGVNRRLARAYELRIDFEELWAASTEAEARRFLQRWTRSALLSRRPSLRKFAKTVRQHAEGILGFFRHDGLTNARQEGMNNKIKLLIHRAFGFRSVPALISMIHLCCSGIQLT